MAGLAGLRGTLFDELKAHVQETDMSVPVRMDGYWYFARTREAASTPCSAGCRCAARTIGRLRKSGEPAMRRECRRSRFAAGRAGGV